MHSSRVRAIRSMFFTKVNTPSAIPCRTSQGQPALGPLRATPNMVVDGVDLRYAPYACCWHLSRLFRTILVCVCVCVLHGRRGSACLRCESPLPIANRGHGNAGIKSPSALTHRFEPSFVLMGLISAMCSYSPPPPLFFQCLWLQPDDFLSPLLTLNYPGRCSHTQEVAMSKSSCFASEELMTRAQILGLWFFISRSTN